MDITSESRNLKYAARKMDSDTAAAGERSASLLSAAMRMCGNEEKAKQMASAADVLRKRFIQASGYEEQFKPNVANQRRGIPRTLHLSGWTILSSILIFRVKPEPPCMSCSQNLITHQPCRLSC